MFPKENLREKLSALSQKRVYLGTSSWKYEGWLGWFYEKQRYITRNQFSQKKFDEHCLGEYAQVLKTVGVDATFYQFPDDKRLHRWMDLVPPDFKFGFKVTSDITLKRFPKLPQHGAKAGTFNRDFLNAEMFIEKFLTPLMPFQERVGVCIFEFTSFRREDYVRGRDFVSDLDKFLEKLPRDWNYAVEIRNSNLLHPDYFQVLAKHRVAHVFNHWTRMPPVSQQIQMQGSFTTDFTVARFLLSGGRTYAKAVAEFSPYREIKAVDPWGRQAAKDLLKWVQNQARRPSFIFVNNRFEGNSLKTICGILEIETK